MLSAKRAVRRSSFYYNDSKKTQDANVTSDKRHADYLLGNTAAEHERLIGLCRAHSLVDKNRRRHKTRQEVFRVHRLTEKKYPTGDDNDALNRLFKKYVL